MHHNNLPYRVDWAVNSWHQFGIYVLPKHRDNLRKYLLEKKGIETMIHYPVPPHRHDAFSRVALPDLPLADELAASEISLPIGTHITPEDAEYIAESVLDFMYE